MRKKSKTAKSKNTTNIKKSKDKLTSKASTSEGDIIQLILKDHIPLKKLIKTLSDQDATFSEKEKAFVQFAPLLMAHAKPEEQSLYESLKKEDSEIRTEGFEGATEHAIADKLIEDIQQTKDHDEWMAMVKVLGELVQHHIDEEEGEMFKMVRNELDIETRVAIGAEYTRLKNDFEEEMEADETQPRTQKPTTEQEKFL